MTDFAIAVANSKLPKLSMSQFPFLKKIRIVFVRKS